MFPIELILKSPLEHWNPHNVPAVSRTTLQAEKAAGQGKDQATPYTGYNLNEFYYKTPFSMFSDSGLTDPADTSREAWITDGSGAAVKTWASGQWIFTPDNSQRLRFPCYPLSQDFSYESGQMENLKPIIKSLLKDIVAGTITIDQIDEAF